MVIERTCHSYFAGKVVLKTSEHKYQNKKQKCRGKKKPNKNQNPQLDPKSKSNKTYYSIHTFCSIKQNKEPNTNKQTILTIISYLTTQKTQKKDEIKNILQTYL